MIWMPGRSFSGPFPPLKDEETEVERRLREHVRILAGQIGERNVWQYDALQEAERYLDGKLRESGYSTAFQDYQVEGKTVRNLEAELGGTSKPAEILVIGAHYDSAMGCPGANDNGSGVAALLEIARLLAGKRLERTVRFVAFVNEEPPFFQTEAMGSLVYARRCKQRNEAIVAMLSLETIGYYTDAKGSQQYPFPFSLFYPDTGDFLGFVANLGSRSFLHRAVQSFREQAKFPSEGVAAPGWMMGIGWSDHWAFWQQGYPAVMVTDTALFRYPYYHTAEDTPDRVVYDRLARVTAGLAETTANLAGD